MLTANDVREFKLIYLAEFGVELEVQEAEVRANEFYGFMELVLGLKYKRDKKKSLDGAGGLKNMEESGQ